MTTQNSRDASNGRDERDKRTAKTVRMPAKAGMLLKAEMAAAAGAIALSWMSSTVGPLEHSKEDSNIQQGHQQQ